MIPAITAAIILILAALAPVVNEPAVAPQPATATTITSRDNSLRAHDNRADSLDVSGEAGRTSQP
jgi:hypothetical protein